MTAGVGEDASTTELVFVLEQMLGHISHGRNLERAVAARPDIAAHVIRIGPRDRRLASHLPALRSWSFEASWAARAGLRTHLSRRGADALFIHTQVPSLLSVGIMRTVPTVLSLDATPINYDSLGESYGHKRQGALVEWGKRQVNRRSFVAARRIVTHSQWAADSVVGDYGISERKLQVIRPGVDLRRFRPGPERDPSGATRILFVGGDFTRKGGDDLLDALRQVGEQAELDIVTMAAPASIPPGLRVRVHLGLGHESEEFFDLYRRADIFAFPSRGDCSPHVVSEALASGLPVVACNVGGVSEVVVDGHNGILVPAGATDQLAEALRMLIERPDLRRTMGERGLRMAQREHDADRNAEAIFQLMTELSREAAGAASSR